MGWVVAWWFDLTYN